MQIAEQGRFPAIQRAWSQFFSLASLTAPNIKIIPTGLRIISQLTTVAQVKVDSLGSNWLNIRILWSLDFGENRRSINLGTLDIITAACRIFKSSSSCMRVS